MPIVYQKLGIRFQYPDNWALDEEDALAGNEAVSVYSPQGAFWSIAIHPAHASPSELAEAALAAMREEYPDLDAAPVSERVAGHDAVGYELNFYCLDLTNTAQIRGFRSAAASFLMLWQAEDRDYLEMEPVFRAISASLVL